MYDLLETSSSKGVLLPLTITVAGGVPSVTEGINFFTVVDGGVGVYQVAFGGLYGAASLRVPTIIGLTCMSTAGNEFIANVVEASVTVSGFTIEVNDDAGTASDMTVSAGVMWYGRADQR